MNEKLDESLKNLAQKIGIAIGTFIMVALYAWISYTTYNEVATVYNLPALNYWVFYGTLYVLKWVHTSK